jgi:hypothetical protein
MLHVTHAKFLECARFFVFDDMCSLALFSNALCFRDGCLILQLN